MEGMMKAFELPFCLRTLERVVFFFPQVVLCADDALGSVVATMYLQCPYS